MAKGKVVQIIGTVVDVEFPPDELPAINNAIEIVHDGERILLETQQHIGNNWVRCLSLSPTDGLQRGVEAVDTGQPVMVPVGLPTLGRLFNVFGEPLDNLGEVKTEERWPIHRLPPALEEQETATSARAASVEKKSPLRNQPRLPSMQRSQHSLKYRVSSCAVERYLMKRRRRRAFFRYHSR